MSNNRPPPRAYPWQAGNPWRGGAGSNGARIPGMFNPVAKPMGGGPSNVQFQSGARLIDGRAVTIFNQMYDTPRPISVHMLLQFVTDQSASQLLLNKALNRILVVLGTITIGSGGTSTKYDFDMPVGQPLVWSGVAQNVQVSARIIAVQIPVVGGGGLLDLTSFAQPAPVYTGDLATAANVRVLAFGGEGVGPSLTNLTRRARFIGITEAAGAICGIPIGATTWRVLTAPGVTAVLVQDAVAGTNSFGAPGGLPTDAPERPLLVENGFLQLQPDADSDGANAEIVFRLGLSGIPS